MGAQYNKQEDRNREAIFDHLMYKKEIAKV